MKSSEELALEICKKLRGLGMADEDVREVMELVAKYTESRIDRAMQKAGR